MIHLVTFTDSRMTTSADNLEQSAYKNGVDRVIKRTPEKIPELYREIAGETLKESKGSGLYCWKPWVVFDAMLHAPDGTVIIYADAGQTIISPVQSVINHMTQDVMLFSNGWKHVEWCKADVYAAINGVGSVRQEMTDCGMFTTQDIPDEYYASKQTQASLIFFKVTEESRRFVKEWMLWCLMPGFCDNSPSKLPNVPTFQETRWDQSVLCCLGIKYGYKQHWFPSLTNYHNKDQHPEDNYPALVDHHRKRNPGATQGTDSEW